VLGVGIDMSAPNVTPTKPARQVPTLALSVEEACRSLGVSWDFWRANIEADVRVVRVGRRKLIAVREIEKWLDEHAEAVR
jgi:hypothetical protein